MEKMIKLYLRKSRSDGEYESVEEVLLRHERQLQEYCQRVYKHTINEENIYREVVSGETIEDRPMMVQLLKEIENGLIDSVVVIEPQRLSRGSYGDIERIVNTFRYSPNNTKIATPMKTYDLNSKYDRKMFEQELLRGNDYLEYTKEILSRGRIASVKNGYYIGSVLPFGYDKIKVNKEGYVLIPNENADIVILIFDKYLSGIGINRIANYLADNNIKSSKGLNWTPSMVRNLLSRPVYKGYLTYGKRSTKKRMVDGEIQEYRPINNDYILVKGKHEPIIAPETFDKVQEMLKSKSFLSVCGDKEIVNPLAGLVYCKVCGKSMIRGCYRKAGYRDTIYCTTHKCPNAGSYLEFVEARVLSMIKDEVKNYKYYVENYETEYKKQNDDFIKQTKKIDKQLKELGEDMKNALVKYNRNKITEEEYTYLKNYTNDEVNRLNGLKNTLKIDDEFINKKKAIPILEKCLDEYSNIDNASDKHDLLASIIDKVIYYKNPCYSRKRSCQDKFELELFLKI